MKKQRAHQRYHLGSNQAIHAQITHPAAAIHLVTLGAGGCSFWLSEEESQKIKTGDSISCRITVRGSDLHFQSKVIYAYPFPHEGKLGKCVGVEFLDATEDKLRLIQNACELLKVETKARNR